MSEWKPIVLNESGEALDPYPRGPLDPKQNNFDNDTLDCVAGIHHICRGWVDTKEVSPTHKALRCRSCGLRVLIPKELKTLGDLRRWAAKQFEQAV